MTVSSIQNNRQQSLLTWAKRANPANSVELLINVVENAPPIDPQINYAKQIHQIIFQAIIEGKLPPGTPISEQSLVTVFEVSRTPIRAALQMLEMDDLVWIFPQSITVVAPIRRSKIFEGIFVRSALESANLRGLVKTIKTKELNALEKVLQLQMSSVKKLDYATFTIHDDRFHQMLFQFAGNENIWDYIIPIKRHLDRVRWILTANVPEHIQLAYAEHCAVLKSLKEGNEEALISDIEEHIHTVTNHISKIPKDVVQKFLID